MRVSTLSGSLRVTTTSGLLRFAMVRPRQTRHPCRDPSVQVSLTAVPDTGVPFDAGGVASPSATEAFCNRWICEDKRLRRSRRGCCRGPLAT